MGEEEGDDLFDEVHHPGHLRATVAATHPPVDRKIPSNGKGEDRAGRGNWIRRG